jgi:hypothetical protein
MDLSPGRFAKNTSMVEIKQDANIWNEKKNSTNLDGLNTSTSSMETMPIEITLALKYVNVCPEEGGPKEAAKNLCRLVGIWVGNVSLGELS